MCGFSRRFDDSYRDAFQKMDSGLIGRPSIFRSQTCDKLDPSGFFVAYAEFSGGIFVDCSIHDIDLALWFFGQDSQVKSVVSSGITAVQPELRKHKDMDNAVGIVEFYGGQIAYLFCSRMMAAGTSLHSFPCSSQSQGKSMSSTPNFASGWNSCTPFVCLSSQVNTNPLPQAKTTQRK